MAKCGKAIAQRYLGRADVKQQVAAQRRMFLTRVIDGLAPTVKRALRRLDAVLKEGHDKEAVGAAKAILDYHLKLTRAEDAILTSGKGMIDITPQAEETRGLPAPAELSDEDRIKLIRRTSFESPED